MATLAFAGAPYFAAASFLGVIAADAYVARIRAPGDERPRERRGMFIIVACAVLGAFFGPHLSSTQNLVCFGVLIAALSAIWCVDVRRLLIPDVFSLSALGVVVGVALAHGNVVPAVSALAIAAPFAIAAASTKGRGMGWGDVKLAALGGAVLGIPVALAAFAIASFVVGLNALVPARRNVPVAFAPYMIAAIMLAMPLTTA